MGLEDCRHQPVQVAARLGRQGDHGRAPNLRQLARHLFLQLLEPDLGILHQIPFGQDEDQGAALALHQVGDLQVLDFQGVGGVHHQQDHLGKGDGADGVLGGKPLEFLLHLGLAAQACGVHQPHSAIVPGPVHGNGVAGDAGLGPREQAILADQAVHQGGLAGVGAPDNGQTHRLVAQFLFLVLAGRRDRGQNGGIEVGHAFAVLRRKGHRLPKAQAEGVHRAGLALPSLGLVGDQDDGLAAAAQDFTEHLVQGRDAFAGVHDEQGEVGLGDGQFGLAAHTRLQALVCDVLKAGGVDQLEIDVAQAARGEAAVAGHARLVIDDGQLATRKAVEQGRLAYVRAADNGDLKRHGAPWRGIGPGTAGADRAESS